MAIAKDVELNPSLVGISWTCRTLSGPDARDFLHRLTTLDVRRLAPGAAASWGFILTPVGKVRAAFHLVCIGPEEFRFEYDAGPEGIWDRALAEAIDQFTFAERQTLSEMSGQGCRWVFSEDAPQVPSGVQVIDHGSRDFGRRWWTLWGEASVLDARPVGEAPLEEWRCQALRPWFSVELSQEVMPLEVGLIDGISQGKGCYPGQEVIERILTQGAPPRRLARVRSADGRARLGLVRKNEVEPGTSVKLADGFEGKVEQCADFS